MPSNIFKSRLIKSGLVASILLLASGASFAALRILGPLPPITLASFALRTMVSEVAIVNVVLAGFNMLPILPLDGAKVWHWNKSAYVAVAGIAAILVVAVFTGAFSI